MFLLVENNIYNLSEGTKSIRYYSDPEDRDIIYFNFADGASLSVMGRTDESLRKLFDTISDMIMAHENVDLREYDLSLRYFGPQA